MYLLTFIMGALVGMMTLIVIAYILVNNEKDDDFL